MKRRNLAANLIISLILLGAAAPGNPARPVIAGPWKTLFTPHQAGRYINDHCLFQDPQNNWRLIGITGDRPLFGQSETFFANAVTPSLNQPMTELPPLFDHYPDDRQKWAPHAVWDGNTLHLFAGPGPIRHYTSNDGYQFHFAGIAIADRWKWLRDTMVLKLDDRWIMYATDRVDGRDVISAFQSRDLYDWSFVKVVFTAGRPAPVWAPFPNSACESPFVIARDGLYYLSTTITNYPLDPHDAVYLNTLVFVSPDPLDFGLYAPGRTANTARLAAAFAAHAPEYVRDQTGQWFITTAGWINYPRPPGCPGGQVCIAPIDWEP